MYSYVCRESKNQTLPIGTGGILYLYHPKGQPLCLVGWTSTVYINKHLYMCIDVTRSNLLSLFVCFLDRKIFNIHRASPIGAVQTSHFNTVQAVTICSPLPHGTRAVSWNQPKLIPNNMDSLHIDQLICYDLATKPNGVFLILLGCRRKLGSKVSKWAA